MATLGNGIQRPSGILCVPPVLLQIWNKSSSFGCAAPVAVGKSLQVFGTKFINFGPLTLP
jgi:hypothetical protein